MVLNALFNVGGLIAVAISISDAIKGGQEASTSTTVEIIAGLGAESSSLGGGTPAIALWNAQGNRLGQWKPGKKDIIKAGTSKAIKVDHKQGEGQPEYIQLTTVNDDAICITSVTVAGNGVSWNWLGDIGYTCDKDWYPSTAKFGSANYQPRCTWLDANHSNDLRFIAMSMHMPDFNANAGLVKEYTESQQNLCHSKARFMMWGQLDVDPGYDHQPPFFKPELEYNRDGSDKDFDALFKPGWADKRDESSASNTTVRSDGTLGRRDHVVISDYKAHNAAEVCGSESSRGPSFVSTQDNTYCDMSTKTAYPLCSTVTRNKCFDVESKQLLGETRLHPRDLESRTIHKRYASHERWTPEDDSM